MKTILFTMVLLLSSFAFVQSQTQCATGNEKVEPVNSELELEVLTLVNIEREKEGLSPLVWNNQLGYAARYHAMDMATDNYFKHDSYDIVDGSLVMVCKTFDRIAKFYTEGFSGTENISAGNSTAAAIVDGWMNSPGHKQNILDPNAKYLGIGYYQKQGSDWTHYCVQCFGS